jgi:hypothetical protein
MFITGSSFVIGHDIGSLYVSGPQGAEDRPLIRPDERLFRELDKLRLGRAAFRAEPVLGQIFKRGARLDPVIRIAFRGIIDVATQRALVPLHHPSRPRTHSSSVVI